MYRDAFAGTQTHKCSMNVRVLYNIIIVSDLAQDSPYRWCNPPGTPQRTAHHTVDGFFSGRSASCGQVHGVYSPVRWFAYLSHTE